MRATLREVLLYHLLQDKMGEPDGVLSVDETGWEYLSPPVVLSQKTTHTCIPFCPLAHMAPGQGTASRPP